MTKPKPKSQVEAVAHELFRVEIADDKKHKRMSAWTNWKLLPASCKEVYREFARCHLRKLAALKLKRK